jgi:hypothetical protein
LPFEVEMAFEIKGTLQTRIGNRVTYGAPKDVETRGGKSIKGTILDEVWENPAINTCPPKTCTGPDDWGDYSFFAQLIKWDASPDSPDGDYSVRLGYYRRRAGTDEWRFAGQTTISSTPAQIKSLLEKTLAKTQWFKLPATDDPHKGDVLDVSVE